MAALWHREVDTYKVDIFQSSTLHYERAIRLQLKTSGGQPTHTVNIKFVWTVPGDYIKIGSSHSEIQMQRSHFDSLYHLLQTENPVYFTAYEYNTIRFAGFTTDEEASGEGFKDTNFS